MKPKSILGHPVYYPPMMIMSVPHDSDHVIHLAPEQLAQGGPGGEGAITRQARTEENKPGLGGFTHLETLSN